MGNPILFGESIHIVQFFLVSRSVRIIHNLCVIRYLDVYNIFRTWLVTGKWPGAAILQLFGQPLQSV